MGPLPPSALPPNSWAPDRACLPGLKLPRTKSDWHKENAYFHYLFAYELTGTITDLESFVPRAQDSVYQHFANKDFVLRYADYSIKALRSLKSEDQQFDACEIRYVSDLIRSKLAKKPDQNIYEAQYQISKHIRK